MVASHFRLDSPCKFLRSQSHRTLFKYREILKPGSYAAYREIENKIASGCMELGFPHPYIGIEPLTVPQEIWFLNGFGEAS
jgi:hypothetical protein